MEIYIAHVNSTTFNSDEMAERNDQITAFDAWPTYGDISNLVAIPEDLDRDQPVSEEGLSLSGDTFSISVGVRKTMLVQIAPEIESMDPESEEVQ